ncbi:hypothetical protein CYMTET_7831 [Cymbomonas tetramitiformis]|uniref:Uncharacterized protein n=1 Tax=Cymbomonas tetramitiformis TaxID=36881 RepID=A0AAE0LGH6_9CHLO|nr:hypothetical protein CYMTET_7831 [Cymbomonas tetramitiformis]
MARGGRQFRSDAVDYSRGEVEVEARASASVQPRFDLQDGFHALGIHPDFQRFMQFDLQGSVNKGDGLIRGDGDGSAISLASVYDVARRRRASARTVSVSVEDGPVPLLTLLLRHLI